MRPSHRWLIVVLIVVAALGLAACSSGPATQTKIEPAILEPIGDGEYSRVVLTEKAAERLDIQTTPLHEEQLMRTLTVGGQIMAAASASSTPGEASAPFGLSGVLLRVPINEADLTRVDQSQPAHVSALTGDAQAVGMTAQPVDLSTLDDGEDDDAGEAQPDIDADETALYYLIDSDEPGLVQGQGVFVELSMSGNGALRKVVPYAAVLYGVNGETWVYTNPEPLVFVRSPITIDYIEGDLAVLSEGPEVGTAVVTLGAAELFGTETGVSK
ncbi:MAG TPA: hypothetical protein VFZ76_19900 [Anaerolineales bacterium]